MNTVWKAEIPPIVGVHEVRFPECSDLFIAGYAPGGMLCVWAKVDTYFTLMKLSDDAGTHLGTFVIDDLVYHVFKEDIYE